jgi:quercetin dioxygenase-like cupin family protein
MEIETLKAVHPITKDFRSSNCTLLAFDLPSLIATMKQSFTWANGELNALILLKSPEKQIILTAMHAGTEIKSFQSNDSITFEIIEGRLRFHIRKDSITLNKGQLMTLDENIKYRLTTQEETVFLLTISNGTTRVANN